MANHPNRSKQPDTGPLMPGQVVAMPKKRHVPTFEQKVWAAVNDGKRIRQVVEALENPSTKVSFILSELETILDFLDGQIADRRDLHSALMHRLNDAPIEEKLA
jgi:hypothetical protein